MDYTEFIVKYFRAWIARTSVQRKLSIVLILFLAWISIQKRFRVDDTAPGSFQYTQTQNPTTTNQSTQKSTEEEKLSKEYKKLTSPDDVKSPLIDLVKDSKKLNAHIDENYSKNAMIRSFFHYKYRLANKFKTFFFILLVITLTSWYLGQWNLLRNFSKLLLKCSKTLLIIISLLSILIAYIWNTNVWIESDFLLFWFPIGTILVGALGFRLLDPNYPTWRTLFTSLGFVLISGISFYIKLILTAIL